MFIINEGGGGTQTCWPQRRASRMEITVHRDEVLCVRELFVYLLCSMPPPNSQMPPWHLPSRTVGTGSRAGCLSSGSWSLLPFIWHLPSPMGAG